MAIFAKGNRVWLNIEYAVAVSCVYLLLSDRIWLLAPELPGGYSIQLVRLLQIQSPWPLSLVLHVILTTAGSELIALLAIGLFFRAAGEFNARNFGRSIIRSLLILTFANIVLELLPIARALLNIAGSAALFIAVLFSIDIKIYRSVLPAHLEVEPGGLSFLRYHSTQNHKMGLSICAAACAHIATLLILFSRSLLIASLFVLIACFIVAINYGDPDSKPRLRATLAHLSLVTIIIMLVGIEVVLRTRDLVTVSASLTDQKSESSSATRLLGSSYPGVILLSQETPAPANILMRTTQQIRSVPLRSMPDQPLVIPFTGVYWFFRYPDTRVPGNVITVRGRPSRQAVYTSDAYPLRMEAHQYLATSVDFDCCSALRVYLFNADNIHKSVSLRITLVDHGRIRHSQSLGMQQMKTIGTAAASSNTMPTKEVLTFNFPVQKLIQRFDEIIVIFQLDGPRDRGAKIDLEQFMLLSKP